MIGSLDLKVWVTTCLLAVATGLSFNCPADDAKSAESLPLIEVKPADTDTIKWFFPYQEPFRLEGFEWFATDKVYERLPVSRPDKVVQYPNGIATTIPASQCGAFGLTVNTAGGQVHFRTDSSCVRVAGEVLWKYGLDNIAMTGGSGFDLYYRENEGDPWVLAGVSRYDHSKTQFDVQVGPTMTRKMRDCILYFPTYNGVKSLAIGLDKTANLEAPAPRSDARKIVFYGTSITEGGCASRGGIITSASLGRDLNMQVLNYGFSGNGKGEPELAQILASVKDPALYILDYDWNIVTAAEMETSLTPFIDILRKEHPRTPILVMSHTPGSYAALNQADNAYKTYDAKKAVQIKEVDRRKALGDKKIEFLDGDTLLGDDWWECLSDGVHLSDMGFYRQEKAMLPVVKKLLAENPPLAATDWPFVIVRQMPCVTYSPDVMAEIFESFEKNPGSCDEIWFCGMNNDVESAPGELKKLLPFRDRCRELGIQFSYQLPLTLGHGSPLIGVFGSFNFDQEDFRMLPGGNRNGDFCPNSEVVRNFLYDRTKLVMQILQPDSFWPDDDLRLTPGCFCPRCLERFKEFCGCDLNREQLYHQLMGETGKRIELRKQWMEYKGMILKEVAAIVRKAVDEYHPTCRVGLQAVYSNWNHSGIDKTPELMGLSGDGKHKVGIRPGCGFYSDNDMGALMNKYLAVSQEAERCRQNDVVAQICYEAENYPHIGLQKNPQFMMVEASLMLAGGVDSLALYWHSSDYHESQASYDRFARLVTEYRPYWEQVNERNKGTFLYGIARPFGKDFINAPISQPGDGFWVTPDWEELQPLLTFGLPLCPPQGKAAVTLLTDRSIDSMSVEELEKVLAGPVILDTQTLIKLNNVIPLGLNFKPYVGDYREMFGKSCYLHVGGAPKYVITSEEDNLESLSTLTTPDPTKSEELGCVSAVITTKFGGKILSVCGLTVFPTEPKRKAILDGLDKITSGKMQVRLEPMENLVLIPRVNAEGKTASIAFQNMSPGETDTLVLKVKNPATSHSVWSRPRKGEIKLTPEVLSDGTLLFKIPALQAYEIGTLNFL